MTNREIFEHSIPCFADPLRMHESFELYSDSIVLHGYQGVEPGLSSVRQFYAAFWKTFSNAQVINHDLLGEGDTVVARYTITGTLRESFMGVPATGTNDRAAWNQHPRFQRRQVLRALDLLRLPRAPPSSRRAHPRKAAVARKTIQ